MRLSVVAGLRILENSGDAIYRRKHPRLPDASVGMKRLGVVENITYDGTVLVRSEFAPAVGQGVVDKRRRPLGRIVRVFGPVHEPFASLRTSGPASPALVGAEVYLGEEKHADEKDRRGRRSH